MKYLNKLKKQIILLALLSCSSWYVYAAIGCQSLVGGIWSAKVDLFPAFGGGFPIPKIISFYISSAQGPDQSGYYQLEGWLNNSPLTNVYGHSTCYERSNDHVVTWVTLMAGDQVQHTLTLASGDVTPQRLLAHNGLIYWRVDIPNDPSHKYVIYTNNSDVSFTRPSTTTK